MQTFAPKTHGYGFELGRAGSTQEIHNDPKIQAEPKTVGIFGYKRLVKCDDVD
jgi:hypothetical protein